MKNTERTELTNMKRTNYKICCGLSSGYPVYRSVVTDGVNYYVKWHGRIIDVTEDIKNGEYSYKR